ncbi:MAG: tRNA (guanosine(46)-N7)-methyltransferase TrmB [Bacilli bacterium]|nr:tRNA (guanosine(46)-N7)-methyltransferase TrmB [Bacilli bacterium]
MRLRNVKNKEDIMNNSNYLVKNYYDFKGDWKELFGNDNPIYIEIGMGKGKFIIENAKMYPDINFIGIEKYDSVIAKGLQKIPDGLNNLFMIRADALDIDEIFFREIDRVYLNFSDPWPKNRHHLRRLSSKIFLDKYENIFKNVEEIFMRTDNRDLYIYSLVSFSENGYKLKKISFDLHHDDMPLITTEYEDKFSKDGLPIYYVECIKDSVQNSK